MKFDKIVVPSEWGGSGQTYYKTKDGRFKISRRSQSEYRWQVRAEDGSEPFSSTFINQVHVSKVFNGHTLEDCKAAIARVYEREAQHAPK